MKEVQIHTNKMGAITLVEKFNKIFGTHKKKWVKKLTFLATWATIEDEKSSSPKTNCKADILDLFDYIKELPFLGVFTFSSDS